jgi:hypothetical protein
VGGGVEGGMVGVGGMVGEWVWVGIGLGMGWWG